VLARLDARGLTLGAVAAVGLASPLAAVSARAATLGQVGFTVPGSILQLSQGVVGMSVNQVKLLAAGLLVACGLGLSAGSGWVSSAGAQPVPIPESAEQRVKRLEDELAKAKKEASQATEKLGRFYDLKVTQVRKQSSTAMQTAKWDYEFADMAETFDAANLGLLLQEREKAGWEFLGSSALAKNGGVPMWLFRKPKAVTLPTARSADGPPLAEYYRYTDETAKTKPVDPADPKPVPSPKPADPVAKPFNPLSLYSKPAPTADDAAGIEAEIKKLQERVAALKAKDASGKAWVSIPGTGVVSDNELIGKLLLSLADKKFGGGVEVLVVGDELRVHGTKEVTDWAKATVKKLTDK
jgi:hypothetical protein